MIVGIDARDIRFPTSRHRHGSDAMNPDPDYSCAYVTLLMQGGKPGGNGLTFTIGRGNDLCVSAIQGLGKNLIGYTLDDFEEDLGLASRLLLHDSQYRWLGPEKGVVHLATAALINAVWDALSKRAGKPLWRYISEMSSKRIASAIDFRHMRDYLPETEALSRLEAQADGRQARITTLLEDGYPAYTTSAGWIGYSDENIIRRLKAAHAEGWRHFKIKVGGDLQSDVDRCALFRKTLGSDVRLSVDANQVWDVAEAVTAVQAMAPYDIYWVEEPISPDDILGHKAIANAVAPIRIATGEHAHNKVMFKQFLQAEAIGFCQIDACRLAGVNEVLAVMLMADKANVPVCPHAGGVGLCEYVQHLSMIDYVCISGTMDERVIEHAAHLHEHFCHPIEIRNGRYLAPTAPGYSIDMWPESMKQYEFPHGEVWAKESVT